MTVAEVTLRGGDSGANESPAVGQPRPLDQLLQELARQDKGQLYAVLDGARTDDVLHQLAYGEVPYVSLFQRDLERYFAVSPLLMQWQPQSRPAQWLISQGWGQSVGVFLSSRLDLERLATQLGQLVLACNDVGERMLFRFHDPRVLAAFLPMCTAAQQGLVFGPVQRWLVEAEQGRAMLEFARPAVVGGAAGDQELHITSDQMEVFSALMVQRFKRDTAADLRAKLPEQCAGLGEVGLSALVCDGITRARQHGIVMERDVALFVGCLLRFGVDFGATERSAWAAEVLALQGVSGSEKMGRIMRHERFAAAQSSRHSAK